MMHLQHRQHRQAMKQAHKAQRHQLNQEVRKQWEQRRLQKLTEVTQGTSSSVQNPASADGRGEKRLMEHSLNDSDVRSGAKEESGLQAGVSSVSEQSEQEKTAKRPKSE